MSVNPKNVVAIRVSEKQSKTTTFGGTFGGEIEVGELACFESEGKKDY
jgi:hypothetical protein